MDKYVKEIEGYWSRIELNKMNISDKNSFIELHVNLQTHWFSLVYNVHWIMHEFKYKELW